MYLFIFFFKSITKLFKPYVILSTYKYCIILYKYIDFRKIDFKNSQLSSTYFLQQN